MTALKAGSGQAKGGFGAGATPFQDYKENGETFNELWNRRSGRDNNGVRIKPVPRDLLDNGRRSGLMGGDGGRNGGGTGNLVVDFEDMPRGVKTSFNHDGMFKDVRLNRGRANQIAEG